MSIIRELGNVIQRTLFTTTFKDIVESLDSVTARIEDLDKKIDQKIGKMNEQIAKTQIQTPSNSSSKTL